jgi:hypothetical protein
MLKKKTMTRRFKWKNEVLFTIYCTEILFMISVFSNIVLISLKVVFKADFHFSVTKSIDICSKTCS